MNMTGIWTHPRAVLPKCKRASPVRFRKTHCAYALYDIDLLTLDSRVQNPVSSVRNQYLEGKSIDERHCRKGAVHCATRYSVRPQPKCHQGPLFATTDAIAERVRKIGGTTIRSIGHIGRLQRLLDNDAEFVSPSKMLAELRDDNKQLTAYMRETHALCDESNDVATASLLEVWIDEAERRTWFLFEITR